MNSRELAGYCSFTKAIEQLGDRWSLLIVRQLGFAGPHGFNDLVAGLPGRVSRSVLANRLRRLQVLGVVARCDDADAAAKYRLTSVGEGLIPTLGSLRTWAETWLPEDPAVVERDPAVLLAWLSRRVVAERLPDRPVVLEIGLHHRPDQRYWLVLQRMGEAYGCLTDPLLDTDRYVYVDCSVPALLAVARGRSDWAYGLADGSITIAGDPALVRELPAWFRRNVEEIMPLPY